MVASQAMQDKKGSVKRVVASQAMLDKKGSAKRVVCILSGLPMKILSQDPFSREEGPEGDG